MRWSYTGRSGNIEDRRGLNLVPGGGLGLGIGGTLLLVVLSFIFKVDFLSLVGGGSSAPAERAAPVNDAAEEPRVRFVSFVLDDAQNTWHKIFRAGGSSYREARLVLYREAVQSACGTAPASTGPFYCPADERVYLDLSFYDDLTRRFGAPGDFAQAYVLAHEIGHHVQNQLGIARKVSNLQRTNPSEANALSVRMELQADCLAGIWGHSTAQRDILERGDVEEALNAASAIGDDRLQRRARGEVNPDTFTHGSSEQRVQWFRRGLESGSLAACDTFGAGRPTSID